LKFLKKNYDGLSYLWGLSFRPSCCGSFKPSSCGGIYSFSKEEFDVDSSPFVRNTICF
jgi:hypothetical protein